VIEITYGFEANTQINNETLQLTPFITPDNSVAWQCGGAGVPMGAPTVMTGATAGTGGTLAAAFPQYLPSACRP
jgi:hypothetical protein